jgi:hypothetical protein
MGIYFYESFQNEFFCELTIFENILELVYDHEMYDVEGMILQHKMVVMN